MREIKFRGKGYDGWEYGSLIIKPAAINKDNIFPPVILNDEGTFCEVDPETVGQYTGLKDKSGKEIYEGDIIKTVATANDHYQRGAIYVTQIVYWQGNFCIETLAPLYPFNVTHAIIVIGNIHDNPELLEGEND